MARKTILNFLDNLSEIEREAVEIAALIGVRFFLDHVLDLSSIKPSKMLDLLDKMVNLNFIRDDSNVGKGAFSFKFKELPDMIVDAMKEDTKKLHLSNIIDYMERELPQNNKKSLILAELLLKFKNQKDAFRHTKRAADLYASAHQTELALGLYKEIIDNLMKLGNEPLDKLTLVDSVISYARIAVNVLPPDEILPLIKKTLPIAVQLKNIRALAMLEVCIGRFHQHKGEFIKATEHYKKGWRLAERTGDKNLIRMLSKVAALSLFWQGRMSDAVQMYEQTLGRVEGVSPDLQNFWASLMLAFCYCITGRIARGLGLAEGLKEKALSSKNLKNQAFADAVIALILLEYRQIDNARSHIDNAIAIGEKLGSDTVLWMVKPCKAYVLYRKGDLIGAKKMLESGISHAKKMGQDHYPSPWILDILWSLHKAKWDPIEGYSFSSEITRLKKWPDIYMRGVALRYEAIDKMMLESDSEEIEAILKQSHDLLKEAGANIELGRTHVELAKFFVGKKDNAQAQEYANMAYLRLTEIDRHLFPPELLFLIQDKSAANRMLKGISELRDAADSLHNQDSYLGKVVTVLTDIFGAERAAILLMEDGKPDAPLQIVATRSFSPEELAQFNNDPLNALIRSTLEKKEPLIMGNDKKNTDSPKFAADNFAVRSLALLPLVVYGKSIGLIYIDNRILKGAFFDKDLAIMTAIAAQVALYLKINAYHRDLYSSKNHFGKMPSHPEKIELNKEFPQIVGKSSAAENVINKIRKVSYTDATVLILGETGVGKELIAQAIHQNSHRADKSFIAVNISALSESLLPSELFGHEKGAFTSADKAKVGRFEMAHLGTIFLDEIGDLSLEAQARLLRVLQEGEFERVGGTQTIHSDFRLIAATNRNLPDMVARGDFRSDLFYRIGTFPIELPPLRDRKEDIPILVTYFLYNYAAKHQKNVPKISESEMKKFLEYSWPGNIRELEHVVERTLILSEGEEFLIPDFEISPIIAKRPQIQTELLPLDEISRRHITMVLNHVKWRIRGKQGASAILGLKPSTLEYRIKQLGIKK